MGLSNEVDATTRLSQKLTIVGGKFTLRVEEGTEGATPRQLTKGKNEGTTVFELKYPVLEGTVVNAQVSESEYPSMEVTMEDETDSFTVQFPLDSGYMRDLSSYLVNADLSKPIKIQMQESLRKNKQGNPYVNLKVRQDGNELQHHFFEFKKDDEGRTHLVTCNGCPDVVEGRSGRSYDAMNEFLIVNLEGMGTTSPQEDTDESEVPF